MRRDRARTEQRLIDAVGQIMAEDGFDQVGINRIASRSGINKILIYRYFGGLDGLLVAYFRQKRPIVSAERIEIDQLQDAPLDVVFDACYQYLVDEYRLLRRDVEAQAFLKADLLRASGVYTPITTEKEEQLRRMIDGLSAIIQTDYGRPFSAIIVSALTLLTLTGQQHKTIFGIDLSTDEGWAQIEAALKNIFRGAYLFTKERLDGTAEEPA